MRRTRRRDQLYVARMILVVGAQLLYTTQHRTVLIISTFILQTIIIAKIMSTGGEGGGIALVLRRK